MLPTCNIALLSLDAVVYIGSTLELNELPQTVVRISAKNWTWCNLHLGDIALIKRLLVISFWREILMRSVAMQILWLWPYRAESYASFLCADIRMPDPRSRPAFTPCLSTQCIHPLHLFYSVIVTPRLGFCRLWRRRAEVMGQMLEVVRIFDHPYNMLIIPYLHSERCFHAISYKTMLFPLVSCRWSFGH